MVKKKIKISYDYDRSSLQALDILNSLKIGSIYNEDRDIRHPLSIYHISIARICDKVSKCSEKIEEYYKINLSDSGEAAAIRDEIVDYLQLTMYSAAEHVDALEAIADTFYKSSREAATSPDVRLFKRQIKPLRDEISNYTNTIKHALGQLRLCEIEFYHSEIKTFALGFFVEGWKNGGVGPHPILHSRGKTIVSITSFLWNVLTFIEEASMALKEFISRRDAYNADDTKKYENKSVLRNAALKLARLPLYSLDDDHPFNRVKWELTLNNALLREVDSGIYGSILTPWSNSKDCRFGSYRLWYAGDGVNRKFDLAAPKTLKLQHWDDHAAP